MNKNGLEHRISEIADITNFSRTRVRCLLSKYATEYDITLIGAACCFLAVAKQYHANESRERRTRNEREGELLA